MKAEYQSESIITLNNSYYITGIIGGNLDATSSKLTMNISNELKKDVRELDIPVSFPWTRLKPENINKSFVDIKNLKFKPLGNLIGFNITSKVYDPVEVIGLNVRTNLFSSDGYFDLIRSNPVENEYITYKRENNNDEINYTLSADEKNALKVNSKESLGYFYTWVMGANPTGGKYLSVGFDIKPVCRDAIAITEKNKIRTLKTPNLYRWKPSKDLPNLDAGKPYFIKPEIISNDLIITEVYHNTNGNNNEHLNIIELYNPSSEPINISNYYLARTTGFDRYNGWGNNQSAFRNAWMYPIQLANEKTSRTGDNMRQELSETQLNFRTFYGSNISTTVAPGKTILLLADQYYIYLNKDGRDLMIEDQYGPGKYVKDKCYGEFRTIQFIVCSEKKSWNRDKPTDNNSHVLKFNPNMGFVLYKMLEDYNYSIPPDKTAPDGKYVIDNKFIAIDSYGPYYSSTATANPLASYAGRFYVIRYDGVIYPSGKEYKIDQWKYMPESERTPSTDITSIGARYMFWKSKLVLPDMPAGN